MANDARERVGGLSGRHAVMTIRHGVGFLSIGLLVSRISATEKRSCSLIGGVMVFWRSLEPCASGAANGAEKPSPQGHPLVPLLSRHLAPLTQEHLT